MLSRSFANLPIDIINTIINYTNVVVYRFGKYINRIAYDDKRKTLIMQIPKPIYMTTYIVRLQLIRIEDEWLYGYILTYSCNNEITLSVGYSIYNKNAMRLMSCTQYIFDKNSKWSKLVMFSM
jgi:hypothetical protein